IAASNVDCVGGYTPAPGDARVVVITVTPSSTGVPEIMNPGLVLDSLPTALVAESVQGLSRDFMLEMGTTAQLTQANVEGIFSNPNYTELLALLAGTSNNYVTASGGNFSPSGTVDFNNQIITDVAAPVGGSDAVNKDY